MKLITLTTLLSALFFTTAMAEVNRELHPFAKNLELCKNTKTGSHFGSFEVDEEIFRQLNKQESNLRMIDSTGVETPFLLRTKKGERKVVQQTAIPFEKLSFNKLPDNQIEIELKKNDAARYKASKVSSVNIASGIKNFEKHVSIWCSDDRSSWQLIAENKPIFDYTRYIDIRNNRVLFPPTDAQYFRLQISNISEKQESPYTRLSRTVSSGKELSATESSSFTRSDFKINEVAFYEKSTRVIKSGILKQPYTSSDFNITEEKKNNLITFSTASPPVTKIELVSSTPYFFRRFIVEVSDDSKTWKVVHSGIISCVNEEPDARIERAITLPRPIRAADWRITIHNNDSPPLDISGIKLEGETREIVFYRDQAKTYRLLYGAEESKKPLYDIAQVISRTESEATAQYTVGQQNRNPDYSETKKRKSLLSRRTIMTIAIILMIAALGWLIAQTVKNID